MYYVRYTEAYGGQVISQHHSAQEAIDMDNRIKKIADDRKCTIVEMDTDEEVFDFVMEMKRQVELEQVEKINKRFEDSIDNI